MDEGCNFMYKSTVPAPPLRCQSYYESRIFVNTQILLCGAVVLECWDFPNLSGPFWHWYCNGNEGASILVSKRRIDLRPGMIYLIPPHTPFATHTTPNVEHLFMHFSVDLHYEGPSAEVFKRPISRDEMRIATRMKKALQAETKALEISFCAQALANIALDSLPATIWGKRRDNTIIDDAIRSIKTGFPCAVDNRALARQSKMPVNAFMRIFKESTGCSPRQFLINLRLQKALHLLCHTSLSIDEIAEKTGFCDRFHFSRLFKIHLKDNPAALRRKVQDKASSS